MNAAYKHQDDIRKIMEKRKSTTGGSYQSSAFDDDMAISSDEEEFKMMTPVKNSEK